MHPLAMARTERLFGDRSTVVVTGHTVGHNHTIETVAQRIGKAKRDSGSRIVDFIVANTNEAFIRIGIDKIGCGKSPISKPNALVVTCSVY